MDGNVTVWFVFFLGWSGIGSALEVKGRASSWPSKKGERLEIDILLLVATCS